MDPSVFMWSLFFSFNHYNFEMLYLKLMLNQFYNQFMINFTINDVYSFPIAAVTDNPKFSGLKQDKYIFFLFWSSEL